MDTVALANLIDNYHNDVYDSLMNRENRELVVSLTAESVDSGEDGAALWVVFKVDGKFYKKTGWYGGSWDDESWGYDTGSADWDGQLVEVVPETTTITTFKEKK